MKRVPWKVGEGIARQLVVGREKWKAEEIGHVKHREKTPIVAFKTDHSTLFFNIKPSFQQSWGIIVR